MDINSIKQHWKKVYETKSPEEVSWTQAVPGTSLDFIHSLHLAKTAKIIDVGGGDSKLVDHLLEEGFENITVLDISAKALEKAKTRLGSRASKVNWVVSEITAFQPATVYDLWHDRASFHFLTSPEEIACYRDVVNKFVSGYLIIATFSTKGPTKCSGLEVKQYDEKLLATTFEQDFEKIKCSCVDHITPFHTKQHFLFCSFKRRHKKQ